MVAATTSHDELPTSRFPVLKRPAPPPLPLRGSQPVLAPIIVPRALGKAKLFIELPIDELDDQEIAQISSWLRGRATRVTVRHPARERVVTAVSSFARSVRERVLRGLSTALVWTLTRLDKRNGSLPDSR
jgi:hypothetical protein